MQCPLLIALLVSSFAAALPIDHNVLVKRVISVEQVLLDQHGNRVGVTNVLVDADTLQPVNTSTNDKPERSKEPVHKALSLSAIDLDDLLHREVFEGLLSKEDKRYGTMRLAMEMAIRRGALNIVETGTARNGAANCGGDGCSTMLLGRLAEAVAKRDPAIAPIVYSVDISPDAVRNARMAVAPNRRVSFHTTDSLEFLDAIATPIDFLYLDSYDYNASNPLPSQLHHLREILAAWNKLNDRSVVLIDDCELSNMGKCRLVDGFMEAVGWKRIKMGYQRLYAKTDV